VTFVREEQINKTCDYYNHLFYCRARPVAVIDSRAFLFTSPSSSSSLVSANACCPLLLLLSCLQPHHEAFRLAQANQPHDAQNIVIVVVVWLVTFDTDAPQQDTCQAAKHSRSDLCQICDRRCNRRQTSLSSPSSTTYALDYQLYV
jgi:hypothetical protein